ncbi:hypothetical protein BC936DRAFT_141289 [Jimgerdemannia flammicorona]|uniref:F-box domain-containing protein n=1 Tax=Jimgerdemannia flammicorona TaxID=994334 RepID=A0A433A2H7_9FUNG|nr:hypothetical protein BC936DRAFT_141289 [Jimgerdemannia flammicorona]
MTPFSRPSANCGLDNCPNEILVKILVLISPHDTFQAALAYRRIAELTRTDWLWQLKLLKDFPFKPSDNTQPSEKEKTYLSTYIRLSSPKVSFAGDKANVAELNDENWSRIPDESSPFGQVIRLKWVCWMAVDGEFRNVRAGQYEVVWRLKVVGRTHPTLFRTCFSYEVVKGNVFLEEQPGEDFWIGLKSDEWTEFKISQRMVVTDTDAGKTVKCHVRDVDSNYAKNGLWLDWVKMERVGWGVGDDKAFY